MSAITKFFGTLLALIVNILSIVFFTLAFICLLNAWKSGYWVKSNARVSAKALFDDIARDKLGSKEIMAANSEALMQLFREAPQPMLSVMKEEMTVVPLDGSIFRYIPLHRALNNYLFGPGNWVGQEFGNRGVGHNVFELGQAKSYTRQFRFYLGRSSIDGKQAVVLDYSAFNTDRLTMSRVDEIRQVNSKLLIGVTTYRTLGGAANPMPYLIKIRSARHSDPPTPDKTASSEGWIVFGKRLFQSEPPQQADSESKSERTERTERKEKREAKAKTEKPEKAKRANDQKEKNKEKNKAK